MMTYERKCRSKFAFTLIELLVSAACKVRVLPFYYLKIIYKNCTSLRPQGRTSRIFDSGQKCSSHLHIFTQSAFTLIELLVVIAIIAILAGMLFPALSKARETGQKSTCSNNMKQFAMASSYYLNTYNDHFCPSYVKTPYLHWELALLEFIQTKNDLEKHGCPSVMPTLKTLYGNNAKNYMAYSVNSDIFPYSTGTWDNFYTPNAQKASSIRKVSRSFMLACPRTDANKRYALKGNSMKYGTTDNVVGNGHRKNSNISFIDGHVENQPLIYNQFFNVAMQLPSNKDGSGASSSSLWE